MPWTCVRSGSPRSSRSGTAIPQPAGCTRESRPLPDAGDCRPGCRAAATGLPTRQPRRVSHEMKAHRKTEESTTVKLTRSALGAVAVCALALGTAACGGSGPSHPGASGPGSSAVLTMEGSPTGPIPRNFNPFSPTSASNILGSTALVYEPLIQYDLVKPGTTYPWLATGYSWSNGGKTITFTIRSGVTWSNGSPFSASDVAYTFNLLKEYPAINTNGLQITSASAPNATTAVISFSSPAYSELYYIAGSTWIVPQSVWSKIGNPSTYSDPNTIGTGPYVLSTYSPNGLMY